MPIGPGDGPERQGGSPGFRDLLPGQVLDLSHGGLPDPIAPARGNPVTCRPKRGRGRSEMGKRKREEKAKTRTVDTATLTFTGNHYESTAHFNYKCS